jgi:hypothetical protein
MTDATKATPLSADIQPKIGAYTSPGVQTPPPAIPQDQVTGKTHGRNPSRARAKSRPSIVSVLRANRVGARLNWGPSAKSSSCRLFLQQRPSERT